MFLAYYFLEKNEEKNLRKQEHDAGRALLSFLLRSQGLDPDTISIQKEAGGRPYIENRPALDFNITHADRLVACALGVGEGRVGIDAEPEGAGWSEERRKRLADRFFSERERQALASGDGSFAEIWTAKEAFLKYTGEGLSRNLRQIDTQALPPELKLHRLRCETYVLTLCVEKNRVNTVEILRPEASELLLF